MIEPPREEGEGRGPARLPAVEAEGRARNLGLIHEVVQQIIGLTDPRLVAEITSELLARYFAYELAAVFIADVLCRTGPSSRKNFREQVRVKVFAEE